MGSVDRNNKGYEMRLKPRILFIDDCGDTNFLHIEYAKMVDENLIVSSIERASQVVDFLEKKASEMMFPNLIFMDINLPFMDGFDLLEAYEKMGYNITYPHTKIYMLSAIEHSSDKKKLQKFPFVSGHLLKPLNDIVLKEILSTIKKSNKVFS